MNIKFSRHAKRRAKLYKIPEPAIVDVLKSVKLGQGEHEIIGDIIGFQYPLKIVVSVKGDTVTVVTNYPLKKGMEK